MSKMMDPPLMVTGHIREWLRLLEKQKKLLVEASRDHGKSWTFSYVYPLYRSQLVKQPVDAIHVALISYSEEQAKKNLSRIRKQIESNEALRWLLPPSKSYTWDTKRLEMSNGCTIEAYGFGSSIRGGHFHLVILDDVCKDRGAGSMSVKEQIDFFYGVIIPALKKRGVGQMVITGNPVDKEDFLVEIEKNAEFHRKFYPAIMPTGEPLSPELYTHEDLEEKRRIVPAHIWAREYLLKRVSSQDALFKEKWIKYYEPQHIDGMPLFRVMTVDPALSPGGDAMAAIVTGTTRQKHTYILDRLSFRGDVRAGISRLVDMMELHQPDYIGTEVFAFQQLYKVWIEEEIKDRGLNFYVEETGRDSTKKKSARIVSLQPKLTRGELFFLPEHKPLVDQLLLWDPTSKTNEDDEIDALAWQVPLWDKPWDGADYQPAPEIREGSFNEAFEQIMTQKINRDPIKRLFSDIRAHGEA